MRSFLVGIALAVVSFALPSAALAQECTPSCRSGFLCHQGTCISACNPVCEPGLLCTPKGQCVSPCNPVCEAGETCNASTRSCDRQPTMSTTSTTSTSSTTTTSAPGNATPATPDDLRPGGTHFMAAVGGVTIPDKANAAAVEAGVVFARPGWGSDLRLFGAGYYVVGPDSKTTGAMLATTGNWWWGVFGVGLGAGLGYASLERFSGTTGSASVTPFLVPAQLGFGKKTRVEIALQGGLMRFFIDDQATPWGYLSIGVVP